MDEFLKPNANLNRLLAEYDKYSSLTIGVDFDGTLYDYHQTGESYELVRQLVRDLKEIGCKIVIWTAAKDLNMVAGFCTKNRIPFDDINAGGIPLAWESRKPFFSALLDDRAGLLQAYSELRILADIHKPIHKFSEIA